MPPAVDRSHGRRARQRRVAGRAADNALHEAPHGSAGSRILRPQLPFHSAVSTEIFRIHRRMALAGAGRGTLKQPSAWQAHADLGRRRPQSSRYPLLCVVPPFSVCSRLQPLAICQVANSGVLLRGGGDGCPMRAGARMKAALRRRAATGVAAASSSSRFPCPPIVCARLVGCQARGVLSWGVPQNQRRQSAGHARHISHRT